jgi:hypothetical protein
MTSQASPHPPRLALRGIEKRYPGVRALAGVDLDVRPGQVHAVLGENGAGKSTLMHVVYGLVVPDAGTMAWEGRPVQLRSPREAIALGIGLVAQHFHLIERHTVLENLALGFPGARPGGRRAPCYPSWPPPPSATGWRSTHTPWSATSRPASASGSSSSRRWCRARGCWSSTSRPAS